MATTEAALQVQSSQEVLHVLKQVIYFVIFAVTNTRKTIGTKQIARAQFKLSLMPNNFKAGPGRTPLPTMLLSFLVQRFWMHDGHFDFLDDQDPGMTTSMYTLRILDPTGAFARGGRNTAVRWRELGKETRDARPP